MAECTACVQTGRFTIATVADGKEPKKEGVVYYRQDGCRVRGVLLRNTWEQVDEAHALIAATGLFRVADLKGRLPAAR